MYPIYSYSYSVPYLLFAFFLLLLMYYEHSRKMKRNKVRAFCLITFILFGGFRGFIFYDWMGYYPMFDAVDTLWNLNGDSFRMLLMDGRNIDLVEPGFVIYMSVIKTIWNNWFFFILLSTAIDVWVFDKLFQRYSANYAFAFFVFFSLHLGMEFNLMRNVKALVIFFLAIDSIYKRQLGQFALWTLLGLSFHRTFLLLAPLYFVGLKDFGRQVWLTIFVIINVIYLFQIPVVSALLNPVAKFLGGGFAAKAATYQESDIYSIARGFTLGYIIRFVTFLLVMGNYGKILSYRKDFVLILNVFLLYIIVNIGMTDMTVFVNRMEILLGFSLWLIYPLLFYYMCGWRRQLYSVFIISYCLLRIIGTTSNAMCDYENVLFGAHSFDERYATHKEISIEIMNK